MDDIRQAVEEIRKLIQNHPRRELLYGLYTMLSMVVEEAKKVEGKERPINAR